MASLRSKVEEHLTCSVCLEQLKDPKVLPCLHSFCHECIVNLAKKAKSNNINCPDCRKVVQVRKIHNIHSNIFDQVATLCSVLLFCQSDTNYLMI